MLLYELATGKSPSFVTSPMAGDVRSPVSGTSSLRLPRTIRPDLPEELEQIILKAAAVKPEDRYPSAESMSSRLEDTLTDLASWTQNLKR
jgi:serine/threonine protein kinase